LILGNKLNSILETVPTPNHHGDGPSK